MVSFTPIIFIAVAFETSLFVGGSEHSLASTIVKPGPESKTLKAEPKGTPSNFGLQRSVYLQRQQREELFLDVARSFKNLTGFIAREAEKANDDLLLSLRITQGQLTQLQAEVPSARDGSGTAELVRSAMEDLARADEILYRKFQANAALSEDFSFMMDPHMWAGLPQHDPRSVYDDFNSAWAESYASHRFEDKLKFSEESSDACLSELKPRQNTGNSSEPSESCSISNKCWRMMSKPNTRDYELTHQLLFLTLGRSAGCEQELERLARQDFADRLPRIEADFGPELVRHQCRGVLDGALSIAARGYPDKDKDLFLEQGMLCGAAVRMPEFFTPSMLRSVMSWQKPSGCYGFVDVEALLNSLSPAQKAAYGIDLSLDDPSNEDRKDKLNYPVGRKLLNTQVKEEGGHAVTMLTGHAKEERKTPMLRREKIMNRSCLSHNSAVAMGYLGVAMRYLAAN